MESVCLMYEFPFGGYENVLELDSGDSCTTLEYTKKPSEMYSLKWLQ